MDAIGRKKGIQAALTSALFLGMAPIFGKEAIQTGFSPIAVTAFRTVLAVVLLFALTIVFQRKYLYIFPVGLIGCLAAGFVNGMGSILYYTALTHLDAGVGHLLYSSYPLFIALWLMIDRQPITTLTRFRLLLSLPAIFLIVQAGGNQSVNLEAAAMMIGSSILYGAHLMINQRVLYEVPAPTVTLYTLLSMSVTVLAAYALFDRTLPQASMPWWPVIALAFITFVSRILLFLGVKHLGGMQTALLGLGELLVAIVVSQLWLGERLTSEQWCGAAILAMSLLLVGFDRFSPEKKRKLSWFSLFKKRQPHFPASADFQNFLKQPAGLQ